MSGPSDDPALRTSARHNSPLSALSPLLTHARLVAAGIGCGWQGGAREDGDWDVAAVLVYARELDSTEIAAVEGYLSQTFGIPMRRTPQPLGE